MNFVILEDIQIKQYFERIGYCQAVYTNLETLSGLQWAHITHIPYENLDILASIPLSLKATNLFQKIIVRKRGGFCFELQGLYKELLESIGFHVVQYSARFMDKP